MYNANLINKAVYARAKMARACRKIAAQYAPVELPESCLAKICTRRKLYNYLEALDLDHASIQAIFWQYDLSVPRDRSLRVTVDPDPRPSWLDGAALETFTETLDANDYLGEWNL